MLGAADKVPRQATVDWIYSLQILPDDEDSGAVPLTCLPVADIAAQTNFGTTVGSKAGISWVAGSVVLV